MFYENKKALQKWYNNNVNNNVNNNNNNNNNSNNTLIILSPYGVLKG